MPSPTKTTSSSKTATSRDRVRAYRERMRAQGMRQVTFWVPDVRSPAFLEQARRESLAIARSPMADDDQAFIDSISEWPPE